MKKSTIAALFSILALLLALCCLALYLFFNFRESSLRSEAERAESEADAALDALKNLPQEQATEPETQPASVRTRLIWVGDSRTLGMRDAMENDDLYIGAAGEGYEWFSSEGLPLLEKALVDSPDSPVIFNLGVNDYDNLSNYLALYQRICGEHPVSRFFFLSVNPIDPELCHNITNEEIDDFNNHLRSAFPESFIDSCTWIRSREILPFDGIHYGKEEYRALYDFTAEELGALLN